MTQDDNTAGDGLQEERTKRGRAVFIRRRKATTSKAIRIKQRQAEVVRYRRQGVLYPDIAKRMRCSI